MYISKVTFYRVPYGEDDVFVPSKSNRTTALLPDSPVAEITDIYPSKDDVFTSFKVSASWNTLIVANYAKITITTQVDGSAVNNDWWGWIDDCENISDVDGAEIVRIRWHVDLWRTWLGRVQFGKGTITRRKWNASEIAGISRPIQNVPFLYTTVDDSQVVPLGDFKSGGPVTFCLMHCIMAYVEGSGQAAKIRYAVWPVAVTSFSGDPVLGIRFSDIPIKTPESEQYYYPILSKVFEGDFGTLFGIDPDQVKGVWLSYVSPFEYTMTSWSPTLSDPVVSYSQVTLTYLNHRAVVVDVEDMKKAAFVRTVEASGVSDEFTTWTILDETGTQAGSFPPGMSFSGGIECSLAVSVAGCYQVFRPHTVAGGLGQYSSAEGCEVRIPCIQIPVTANSWASYVYSGQRDYEISAKRQQIQTAFLKGLTGSVSNGAEGAMAGVIAGKENAGPLAALGLASGIISATSSAAIDTANFDTVQGMTDRQKANQSDGLLFYGGNLSPFNRDYGTFGPCLAPMVIDDYSNEQWTAHANIYGIECEEAKSNLSTYIYNYTGPIQIVNAQIGGVPVKAARYIKKRMAQGVIFI